MDAVEILGYIGCVAAFMGGFTCLFIALVNMFRAVMHRSPGVPLFPSWIESPFNILFYPSQLTERGLAARRRVFLGVVGFLVCWLLGAVIGLSTGVLH